MATVIKEPHIITLSKREKFIVPERRTIQELADEFMPADSTFICVYNGQPILRDTWGSITALEGDIVEFKAVCGDAWVWIAISLVFTVYTYLSIPDAPDTNDEQASSYSLEGQKNDNKLGYPMFEAFGYNKIYPAYAAAAYNRNIDNYQYQYTLLSLGEGYFDTDNAEIYISDTELSNYDDVEYQWYQPGETVDLFPDNVYTSSEVSYIDIYRPDEDDYESYYGPYSANPSGTEIIKIEVDASSLNGFIRTTDLGNKDEWELKLDVEYREIDDDGDPLGDWQVYEFRKTYKTFDPVRRTIEIDVDSGRYEVRLARYDTEYDPSNIGYVRLDVTWDALRGYAESTKVYTGETTLAIIAKATNNLNDNSSNEFNVIITRKLPLYDLETETWSGLTATRSKAAAFCYVCKKAGLTDDDIDLETIWTLDEQLEEFGEHCDWIFEKESTVWKTLETIAGVRCKPTIVGNKYSIIRDDTKTTLDHIFQKDDILSGTFKRKMVFDKDYDYDGIQVEYEDNYTWEKETIDCLIDDDAGENLESVTLSGIKDRDTAYRLGLYLRAKQKYQKKTYSFSIGKNGLLVNYNDYIATATAIVPDVWTGYITSYSNYIVWLSEDFEFEDGVSYQIMIKKKDGTVFGPYSIRESGSSDSVVLSVAIPEDDIADIDSNCEPARYIIGESEAFREYSIVTSVTYGEEESTIESAVYDPRIYSFDTATAPDYTASTYVVPTPDLPTITALSVSSIDDSTYQVSWTPAIGAQYYVIEQSYDGETWASLAETSSTSYLTPSADIVSIRVAGVNNGKGAWIYWSAVYDLYDNDGTYQLYDDDATYELSVAKEI